MNTIESAPFEPVRTRGAGGMFLGVLWILLVALYSAPLWLSGYLSWDFAISVDPPSRTWIFVVLAAIVLLLPPLLLAAATRRWLRRRA